MVRLRVKTYDPYIQVAIVICETDLGLFRGGRPFVWLLLDEAGGRLDLLPHRLIDEPVHHRRRVDALRAYSFAGLLARLRNSDLLG